MSVVLFVLPVKATPGLAAAAAAAAAGEASVCFDGVSQTRMRPRVVVVVDSYRLGLPRRRLQSSCWQLESAGRALEPPRWRRD